MQIDGTLNKLSTVSELHGLPFWTEEFGFRLLSSLWFDQVKSDSLRMC